MPSKNQFTSNNVESMPDLKTRELVTTPVSELIQIIPPLLLPQMVGLLFLAIHKVWMEM